MSCVPGSKELQREPLQTTQPLEPTDNTDTKMVDRVYNLSRFLGCPCSKTIIGS